MKKVLFFVFLYHSIILMSHAGSHKIECSGDNHQLILSDYAYLKNRSVLVTLVSKQKTEILVEQISNPQIQSIHDLIEFQGFVLDSLKYNLTLTLDLDLESTSFLSVDYHKNKYDEDDLSCAYQSSSF